MMLEKQLFLGELVSSGPFFMKAPPLLTALVLVERTRIRLRRTTLHRRVGLFRTFLHESSSTTDCARSCRTYAHPSSTDNSPLESWSLLVSNDYSFWCLLPAEPAVKLLRLRLSSPLQSSPGPSVRRDKRKSKY